MTTETDTAAREVTITRIIAAPRPRVWQAWTDPRDLATWWGPEGFTNPVCEADVRPGGALYILMRGPDGAEHPMQGVFREVVPHERLIFSFIPNDADGRPLIDGLTTVTFSDDQGGTKLTIHTRAVALAEIANRMLDGVNAGWTQSIDRLARLVAPAA
jgi:uncharacterized protein YndB with AHSA1/START domain